MKTHKINITKFWALHFDLCDALAAKKATYNELRGKLSGERLMALEYFHTHELTYDEK